MRARIAPPIAALAVPVLFTSALVPLRDHVSSANLALVLVVGVVGVAASGDRLASITCAVLTAFAYDVFLTQPYGSLAITDPSELLTAFLLLVVGVLVGVISSWARHQRSMRADREADLGLMYPVIEQVAAGATTASLVAIGEREITELLGVADCRYRDDAGDGGAFVDRIGDVHVGDLLWPADEVGLPGMELAIPLQSGGLTLGRFVVRPSSTEPVPRWQLLMAVMIADLIASALARWPTDP